MELQHGPGGMTVAAVQLNRKPATITTSGGVNAILVVTISREQLTRVRIDQTRGCCPMSDTRDECNGCAHTANPVSPNCLMKRSSARAIRQEDMSGRASDGTSMSPDADVCRAELEGR